MTKPLTVIKPWKTDTIAAINQWPLLASEKLDGIRCWIRNGVALTASNKPIPNDFIREELSNPAYEGFDGEIVAGTFRETSSAVMSHGKRPDYNFFVFDNITIAGPYSSRYEALPTYTGQRRQIRRLLHEWVDGPASATRFAFRILESGAEGVCFRDPYMRWRPGRTPPSRYDLVALKPLADGEAQVVGFEELYHNENPAYTDERGLTKRSLANDNRVPAGTLGCLRVIGITAFPQVVFNIGTGFSAADRDHIWRNRQTFLGQLVRFRYLPVGGYDSPRQPRFAGFRHQFDITA